MSVADSIYTVAMYQNADCISPWKEECSLLCFEKPDNAALFEAGCVLKRISRRCGLGGVHGACLLCVCRLVWRYWADNWAARASTTRAQWAAAAASKVG